MIKSLKNAQIADGLPRILGEQPWVKALRQKATERNRNADTALRG